MRKQKFADIKRRAKQLNKEDIFYNNWRGWLIEYGIKKDVNFNIDNYDEEILRDLFANGNKISKAYKELLSEPPKH